MDREVSCRDQSFMEVLLPLFIEGIKSFNDLSVILLNAKETLTESEFEQFRSMILKMKESFEQSEGIASDKLKDIDTEYEKLVARKGELRREKESKETECKNLKEQLRSYRDMLESYRQQLENAKSNLASTQVRVEDLRRRMEHDEAVRNTGIGLMFIPIIGTIIGATLVGVYQTDLDNATSAKDEAEREVHRWESHLSDASREVSDYEMRINQKINEIAEVNRTLENIKRGIEKVSKQNQVISHIQGRFRSAVRVLGKIAGIANVAEIQTRKFVLVEPVITVLEDIYNTVLSDKSEYLLSFVSNVKPILNSYEENSKNIKALTALI